jgi:hypothetical protein
LNAVVAIDLPRCSLSAHVTRLAPIAALVAACATPAAADDHPPQRACAYPEHALRLPYPNGISYRVLQGNDGSFSHTGESRYAWDFGMPVGADVVAAEGGIVVEVNDAYDRGGATPAFAQSGNFVAIDHGDGHFSEYWHLAHDSAVVRENEVVTGGQLIARSGNTGFSTRPHLHFEVVDHRSRSIAVCFAGGDPIPRQDGQYAARDVRAPSRTPRVSSLPRDAFAENGIDLRSDVPARHWSGSSIDLNGRATRSGREVVAYLTRRGTSEIVRRVRAPIARDGSFSASLSLEGIEGPMSFAIGLSSSERHGSYESDFFVPIVVRSVQSTPARAPDAGSP